MLSIVLLLFGCILNTIAQPHLATKDRVIFLTQEWTGDRDKFGRPMVSDELIDLIKYVSVEEAWRTLEDNGFNNQLEVGWEILRPEEPMVGRVFTTAFLPKRPGLDDRLIAMGNEAGFKGGTNQWPMSMLTKGDVIVADHFGKPKEAAFIGTNLAQAIYTNSGNGPIIYGQSRDLVGVREIDGINVWTKTWHPSHSAERMLISINEVIRIGEATVLPGDIVLATESGVLFIPPHLVKAVLISSEVVRLMDAFRQQVIAAGKYTSQQVYQSEWTPAIDKEFYQWIKESAREINQQLHVRMETLDKMIKTQSRDME